MANAANNAGGNVDMGLLIQVSLVFAALSTLLQLYAQKIKLGSGLPVIIGVSFAYVPTMTAIAAQAKDVNTIFGAMIIGGVVAILVGLFIRQIRKVFPPLVIGTVILAIGLSLYSTAVNYMAGNSSNTYEVIVEQQGKTEALVFGSWQNWLVAFITLAIVVLLNHYGKGLFKLASILIGLLCGYVVALCFGMVDFSALSSAGWFEVPMPLAFGIKFDISAILPLAILFLVNSIQAMGDFSATTTGGMDRLPTDDELNGGIIGYGVSNMVGRAVRMPSHGNIQPECRYCGLHKSCGQKSIFCFSGYPAYRRTDSEVFRASAYHPAVRAGRRGRVCICFHSNDRHQAACNRKTDLQKYDSCRTFHCHRHGRILKRRLSEPDDGKYPQRSEYEHEPGKLPVNHQQHIRVFTGGAGYDLRSNPEPDTAERQAGRTVRRLRQEDFRSGTGPAAGK